MIELYHATKIYKKGQPGETIALDQLSLQIDEGEFIAVMGPSGCGKSTLLNIIGCMDQLTSGEYWLNDIAVHKLRKSDYQKIRKQQISFIFQHFALLDHYTVYENVELPLLADKRKRMERKKIVTEALERFGIAQYAGKLPSQLSGGQQQRAAIARAAVMNAPILLADEPTGALDQKNGRMIMKYLKEINQSGTTVIMVTHDEKLARIADRIIYLVDGRIEKEI